MISFYNRRNFRRPSSARPNNKITRKELLTASFRSLTDVNWHCITSDKTSFRKQSEIGVNSVFWRTNCVGDKLGRKLHRNINERVQICQWCPGPYERINCEGRQKPHYWKNYPGSLHAPRSGFQPYVIIIIINS
jgi:hypothetical protein